MILKCRDMCVIQCLGQLTIQTYEDSAPLHLDTRPCFIKHSQTHMLSHSFPSEVDTVTDKYGKELERRF